MRTIEEARAAARWLAGSAVARKRGARYAVYRTNSDGDPFGVSGFKDGDEARADFVEVVASPPEQHRLDMTTTQAERERAELYGEH